MTNVVRLIFLVAILTAISSNAFSLTISAELNSDGNTVTISKEVVETKEFQVTFKPINTEVMNPDLYKIYYDNKEFLEAAYPISETKFKPELRLIPHISGPAELIPGWGLLTLLNTLIIEEYLVGNFSDRIVGIIDKTYLEYLSGQSVKGASLYPYITTSVLIASDTNSVAAHEIGHTFGLCEEYSLSAWENQNSNFPGGCKNNFPEECSEYPEKCGGNTDIKGFWVNKKTNMDTKPIQKFYFESCKEALENRDILKEKFEFRICSANCPSDGPYWLDCYSTYYNIMGNDYPSWVDQSTYSYLLTQFATTPLSFSSNSFNSLNQVAYFSSTSQSLLLSGLADKNGEVTLQDFYIMEGMQEQDIPTGDYSLKFLDSNNNILLNQNFGVSFTLLSDPPIDLNTTAFVFTIPYPEGTHKIQIDFNGQTRAKRLVSANSPTVSFVSPSGGEEWSNKEFVKWNASDLDEDSLSFVLQYSSDNGTTWNPITIGLNETSFELDTAILPPGEQYKLKVIATDGINTGKSISETFTIRNPKIEIEPWLIDFAETKQGTILEYQISLQNSGNQHLEIQAIQTNPQTTFTDISLPTTLAPEQNIEFQMFFDTNNLQGEYDQNVLSIQSNDPKQEWKNIYLEGTITLPETRDGNLHLTNMNSYIKEKEHYSGAATAKIILDYIRTSTGYSQLSQDKLQFYANLNKDPENQNLLDFDAKAMDAVLGHYDPYDNIISDQYDTFDSKNDGNPYQGYNYTISTFPAEQMNEYMLDITHWMAYPVTRKAWWTNNDLVAKPNTPAAIPLYGNYSNWIAVNGFAASENPVPEPETNPWKTANITIYGFWLTDPEQDGIGQHVYITAADANATYFKPMQTNDQYNNMLLQVAEPPPRQPQEMRAMGISDIEGNGQEMQKTKQTIIEIAKPKPSPENLEIIKEMLEKD